MPRAIKAKGQSKPLAGRKATVCVERNGAFIRVDEVPADEAGVVLADILESFRALARKYPELILDLGSVPGGSPIDVTEDEWADEGRGKRRVGF